MSKPDIFDVLEFSLSELNAGERVENILEKWAEFEAELRPILNTSALLYEYSSQPPPQTAYSTTLNKTLAYAEQLRLGGSRPKSLSILSGRVLRFAFALIVVGILLTGVTAQAQSTLPGDLLYPWKRGGENLRLVLSPNEETKRSLETEFGKRRKEEVRSLIALSREAQVEFTGRIRYQADRLWQIDELVVQITNTTVYDQGLGLEDRVVVRGQTQMDGTIQANSILPRLILEKTTPKPTLEPTFTPSATLLATREMPPTIDNSIDPPETPEFEIEGETSTPDMETPEPEKTSFTHSNTPEPSKTNAPTKTIKPTETEEPDETEDLDETETPEDDKGHDPSETPKPSKTPEPSETLKSRKTIEPSDTPEDDD